MPHLEEECALNSRDTSFMPQAVRGRGRGGEGKGLTKLWKIEAEVESEEENWAASHGASLRGQQGPEEKEGL